jgi:hypothetical protein
MAAAPWVNLVVPLSFFLLSRNLLGAKAAVCGTGLLVLFNGLVLPPWMSAAYHPWSSIPILALGGFFLSLWLIHARIHSTRVVDAVLIGSAVGLTFLAHTVPALILAAILPVVAWRAKGFTLKNAGWVTLAGIVAFAWSLPLMLPLLLTYRLHVLNAHPGAYVDPMFLVAPSRPMLLALLPGTLALPIIGWLRSEGALSREAVAILAVWIAVPVLFMSRHYACGPESHATACTVFVVAVHHWYIYLQAALTCLAGFALWLCLRRATRIAAMPSVFVNAGWASVAVGAIILFCMRPSDHYMRQRAIELAAFFDWDAYVWVTQHTAPHDLFVTETLYESLNAASVAVMAAGRTSVALPATYSNPYVEWESRDRRSKDYLEAARMPAQEASPMLCNLVGEAGSSATAYVILPNSQPAAARDLSRAAVGGANTIYRAMPGACMTSDASRLVASARLPQAP